MRLAGRKAFCCVAVLLSLIAIPLHARDYPPDVPPPKPIAIPTPAIQTLPNGLQVVVVERHTLPLITLRLVNSRRGMRPSRPAGHGGVGERPPD